MEAESRRPNSWPTMIKTTDGASENDCREAGSYRIDLKFGTVECIGIWTSKVAPLIKRDSVCSGADDFNPLEPCLASLVIEIRFI